MMLDPRTITGKIYPWVLDTLSITWINYPSREKESLAEKKKVQTNS